MDSTTRKYSLAHQKNPSAQSRGIFYVLDYSSYSHDGTVCRIVADFDAVFFIAGVNDGAAAHVDSYMAGIADDITRLSLRIGHTYAASSHSS